MTATSTLVMLAAPAPSQPVPRLAINTLVSSCSSLDAHFISSRQGQKPALEKQTVGAVRLDDKHSSHIGPEFIIQILDHGWSVGATAIR